MPGYDRMWFGEESSGSNLDWVGTLCWTELDEDLIVVSAQLTDWGERSARQAVELTEYFLENFPVNPDRVYAAGYSAGGETMSQAVAMRPDLYAAYLHGASQWDGDFEPIAENGVAVYIFMAESDEYYGSSGPGTLTAVCMRLMRKKAGQTKKLMLSCKWRFRRMPISMRVALPATIMAAATFYLRRNPFCTGFFPIRNKPSLCHKTPNQLMKVPILNDEDASDQCFHQLMPDMGKVLTRRL